MTTITASDYFCGAGGSSSGLVAAGVEVRHAANHWHRAIETHQTNHPQTEHSIDDLQVAHPSWYPRTTIAWFSPECGFRMLTPEELKLGMAFAQTYIVTGNKREQVKQIGNAVTPPVAQAIAQRCVASLVS